MTKDEMMKKLGLREDKDFLAKNNENLKGQVIKFLRRGKTKILLLEKQISSEKNAKKFQKAKRDFSQYENKAEQYIKQNPKKAAAMVTAAVVLAGSLWSAFKSKKPALKKKK